MDLADEEAEAAEIVAQMLADDAPVVEVEPDWHWIWRAWHRLSADRTWISGGLGPAQPGDTPWTAVIAWADRHGMSQGDESLLDHAILAMDRVFKDWWAEQSKEAAQKPE